MGNTPGAVALPSVLPETPPALRACLFALSGSRFAVDVRSAREVAVFDEFTVVPRAPRQLVGVANLRGTVIPILDVSPLLGLPELRPARSVRTLVLRDGALLAAVAVDTVLGLEPFDDVLSAADPAAPRGHGSHRLVAGWLTWAGETLALLDVPRILAVLRSTLGGDELARRADA
jgi:purine-binding chemotaxis protein CheW